MRRGFVVPGGLSRMFLDKFKNLIIGAVALLFVALGAILFMLVLNGYEELDHKFLHDDAKRVERTLEERTNTLATKAGDWAVWDEASRYVTNTYPEFVSVHITDASIAALKISLIGFLDANDKLLSVYEFDNETKKISKVEPQYVPYLSADSPIVKASGAKPVTGYVEFRDKIASFAIRKVARSDGTGEAGRIFFGQFLDQSFLRNISDQMLMNVTMVPLQTEMVKNTESHSVDLGSAKFELTETIGMYFLTLHNFEGKALSRLQIDIPREVYQHGKGNTKAFGIVFGLMACLVLLGVFFILNSVRIRRGFSALVAQNAKIRQSEAHFRALVESIPGYVSWFDASLKYLGVNQRLADDYGVPQEDFVGKECGFLSPKGDSSLKKLLVEFLSSGKNSNHIEQFLQDSVADRRKFLLCMQKYGKQQHIVVVGIDVTDAWKMQEQSEKDRQLVAYSARLSSLGEMAGGIAHEISNPLTVIQGCTKKLSRLLAGHPQIQNANEILKTIDNTVLRAGKIISGLRTLARDGSADPFVCTSLKWLLEDTLAICSDKFSHAGITLSIEGLDEAMHVNCRCVEISQVLINLLNNAYDAISELDEKWIRIAVREMPGVIEIAVQDSGLGIPAATVDKIMNPFFTTKPVGSGTGLGLSIAKNITTAHGGSLVYDRTKSNTTFVITIPSCRISASPQAA